jgi:fluoride ion exporter CrcB/FEX
MNEDDVYHRMEEDNGSTPDEEKMINNVDMSHPYSSSDKADDPKDNVDNGKITSDYQKMKDDFDEYRENGILMVPLRKSASNIQEDTNTKQPALEYDPESAHVESVNNNDNNNSDEEDEDDDDNLLVYSGHGDLDLDQYLSDVSKSTWAFGKTKKAVIQVLYVCVFSIFGCLVRIIMAQYFGYECNNPGTVGWLKSGQPLCVTADGETSVSGGIIFSDLPANLFGSFIIGFMQSTDTMNLPKTFPIAWLEESHPFQSFDVIHFAICVGFCGSLTTFSSWNSEMVTMILGADSDHGSLIFRGLLGYLIGVETALASFMMGKNLSKYIHSLKNPALHQEMMETKKQQACGVYINTELSDYERQFLSGFDMEEYSIRLSNPMAQCHLEQWRESTKEARRVGSRTLALLTDIEYQAFVLDEDIDEEYRVLASNEKWDMEALKKWRIAKREMGMTSKHVEPRGFRFIYAFNITILIFAALIAALFLIKGDDNYSITYREMISSALCAPIGSLLRWRMLVWNGKWAKYSWFPLGSFLANFSGCLISATCIGMDYRMNGSNNLVVLGIIRSLKVGIAGTLSTISAFVTEFANMLKGDHPIHGYLYVCISIVCCGAVSAIAYASLTYSYDAYAGSYY